MKGLHTQELFESLLTTDCPWLFCGSGACGPHILFSMFPILSHLVLSVHGSSGRRKL